MDRYGVQTRVFAGKQIQSAKLKYNAKNSGVITRVLAGTDCVQYSVETHNKKVYVELLYIAEVGETMHWVQRIVDEIKAAIMERDLKLLRESMESEMQHHLDMCGFEEISEKEQDALAAENCPCDVCQYPEEKDVLTQLKEAIKFRKN